MSLGAECMRCDHEVSLGAECMICDHEVGQ